MKITCEKEFGKWTVRVDGWFIYDFHFAKNALKLVNRLQKVLHD